MNRERWEDLVGMVKDRFKVSAEGKEDLPEGPGTEEFIEFDGPLGHLRCELVTKPVVIGKRAIGGHKVGSGSKVQYEYDPEEQSTGFKVYKKVGEDWQEIDASVFS